MDIADFIKILNDIAPPQLAEDFDYERIGLVIEGKKKIKTIACALDATENTISKAVSAHADILVVHHTPIWNPLTKISGSRKDIIKKALEADLNIFVMHTNFDHAEYGINQALSEHLKLTNCEALSLGIAGDNSLSIEELSVLLCGGLRVYNNPKKLKRIAVCGGSGFDESLIQEAKDKGADAFLSSELKHSVLLSSPLPLIESTHYALESVGMKALAKKMNWIYIEDVPVLRTIP